MSHDQRSGNTKLPAPCIVEAGIIVSKQDMQRLLADLGRVRYRYTQDDYLEGEAVTQRLLAEDEGYVLEVFADLTSSTIVANRTLYINVQSFDYLELSRSPEQEPCFDLVQDSLRLRLMPLSNPIQDQKARTLSAAALEAVVAEVLSAGWDVEIDGEENSL
jgi:hypothetical protein